MYDYDLDKTTGSPIAKNIFVSNEIRFKNKEDQQDRYGSPGLSSVDPTKVVSGKINILKPRIRQ